MASQSHRMCVADSTTLRHLSQVGSSASPSLKRRLLGDSVLWTVLTPILIALCFVPTKPSIFWPRALIKVPLPVLSPVFDYYCFMWILFVQSLTIFLATPIQMPHVQILYLSAELRFHYPQYPHDLAAILVELFYVRPVVWEIECSPRQVLRWSGICQVLQLQLDCLIEYRLFCFVVPIYIFNCACLDDKHLRWNTLVYCPRMKLIFRSGTTPQLQRLCLSWSHLCTRLYSFFCRAETSL
jgi:hypothetical protein